MSLGSFDIVGRLVSSALLAAALGGCPAPPTATSTPQPSASTSPSAALTSRLGADIGAECREAVLSFQDWLRSIEDAGLPLAMSLLDEGASLVARQGDAITDPAPLVHLTTGELYLDGIPVAGSQKLHEELVALIELRRSMMPESPFIQSPKCHLAIGKDVDWVAVSDVAESMSKAGIEQVTFVFIDPERTVPAPPPSPIDAELERMQKSAPIRRAQIIAELVAYVYQDCPEALRVIASMGVNPIADFKQVILDALPEAIGICRCAPDLPSVKSLHWALFGNPRPSSGVTLSLAGTGRPAKESIVLGTGVPWSAAQENVAAVAADPARQPTALVPVGPPHSRR